MAASVLALKGVKCDGQFSPEMPSYVHHSDQVEAFAKTIKFSVHLAPSHFSAELMTTMATLSLRADISARQMEFRGLFQMSLMGAVQRQRLLPLDEFTSHVTVRSVIVLCLLANCQARSL